MADKNYIVPGKGIVQGSADSKTLIVPGKGLFQEQESVEPQGNSWYYYEMIAKE